VRALALALAPLLLPGCGAVALIHDAYIGPISPAGMIHPYVMGEGFRVDDAGIHADPVKGSLLRPLPPDWLRRMGTLVDASRGIEFAVASFSFVVEKERTSGRPLGDASRAKLTQGLTAREVLERLGAPRLFVRRENGSLMAYSAEVGHDLDFRLGVPPGVGNFIPVPGVTNVTFTWTNREDVPRKTLLFFDANDILVSVATNEEAGK
jgi:hypothetical protein